MVGNREGGFVSAITLVAGSRDPEYFAPGMIYGGTGNLSPASIGGADSRGGVLRIREDRLPAPLFGVRLADGSSLAVLDLAPRGDTTVEDSHDLEARPLTDARFQFGALGVEPRQDDLAAGFWFPGTEGQVTYRGNTYPGGQMQQWRRRYHPLPEWIPATVPGGLPVRTGELVPAVLFGRLALGMAHPSAARQSGRTLKRPA